MFEITNRPRYPLSHTAHVRALVRIAASMVIMQATVYFGGYKLLSKLPRSETRQTTEREIFSVISCNILINPRKNSNAKTMLQFYS